MCLSSFQATIKTNKHETPKVAAPKVSKGRSESPLVASAEAKSLLAGKTSYGRRSGCVVAPIWRDNAEGVGSVTWGRVCGRAKLLRRDASLPAAKAAGLSAFSIVGLTV